MYVYRKVARFSIVRFLTMPTSNFEQMGQGPYTLLLPYISPSYILYTVIHIVKAKTECEHTLLNKRLNSSRARPRRRPHARAHATRSLAAHAGAPRVAQGAPPPPRTRTLPTRTRGTHARTHARTHACTHARLTRASSAVRAARHPRKVRRPRAARVAAARTPASPLSTRAVSRAVAAQIHQTVSLR